ncbi:hypothetical protein T05_1173 [Trichinella murrelli]|uniref:Uncharacterized protein n=1 Tax=Trichinella murrelli TaxID=144512 RepID=A0A0V0SPA7_9BILA|nr:hypothetical protein T05_1173 [Trichinella murrelli]
MYSYSYSDRYSNSIHERHTGTARKRLYVHVNKGCQRYKLHGMT